LALRERTLPLLDQRAGSLYFWQTLEGSEPRKQRMRPRIPKVPIVALTCLATASASAPDAKGATYITIDDVFLDCQENYRDGLDYCYVEIYVNTSLDRTSSVSMLEIFCYVSAEVQKQDRRIERTTDNTGHAYLNVAQGETFTGFSVRIEPNGPGEQWRALKITDVQCDAFPHSHMYRERRAAHGRYERHRRSNHIAQCRWRNRQGPSQCSRYFNIQRKVNDLQTQVLSA
jgi:hypothetical protein